MVDSTLLPLIRERFLNSLSDRKLELLVDEDDLDILESYSSSPSHSYLFAARTAAGRELARYFFLLKNCPSYQCKSCTLCEAILKRTHPDFIMVGPEGSEIVRRQVVDEVIRFAMETPVIVQKKFILIEEAHLLNIEASNALLKVLEEPPASTVFILITEKSESLLPTVTSRLSHIKLKSQIEEVKDPIVSSLIHEFLTSLSERKGLHNLDKKLKEVVQNYSETESVHLKENIEFLNGIDFDPRLKKKIIALEKHRYERLKRKYENDLIVSFFLRLKKLIFKVFEMKAGGKSFLEMPGDDIELFDIIKRFDMAVLTRVSALVDEAIELISSEVKPDYVLKGFVLKCWMVIYR